MKRVRSLWLGSLLLCATASCGDDAVSQIDAGFFPDASRPRIDSGADASRDGSITDGGADATVDAPGDSGTGGDGGPSPPVVDGVIGAAEYGVHTDGQNQQVSDVDAASRATWYMTWDDTNVYVGVTVASVTEALVLYVDTNPLAVDAGTNADGTTAGFSYDNVVVTLPMRADFVAYSKSTYNEYRHADGAGAWGSPTANALTQVGTGSTREIRIPWSAIRSTGRPSSFAWTGYVVSNNSQYVYAEMPPGNPGGSVGAGVTFTHVYRVDNATPYTGTKPFANDLTP